MTVTLINKLVRDNIPSLMERDGATVEVQILDQNDYIQALKRKLIEEAKEVEMALTRHEQIEELADLFEVAACLMAGLGITEEDVQKGRLDKNDKKGSFKNRVFVVAKTM